METVMYGNTIIWSSLTNPSAAHCIAAARSPKNNPVRMPPASPIRICRENVIRPPLHGREPGDVSRALSARGQKRKPNVSGTYWPLALPPVPGRRPAAAWPTRSPGPIT